MRNRLAIPGPTDVRQRLLPAGLVDRMLHGSKAWVARHVLQFSVSLIGEHPVLIGVWRHGDERIYRRLSAAAQTALATLLGALTGRRCLKRGQRPWSIGVALSFSGVVEAFILRPHWLVGATRQG